ncbi:MAG: hypothetical protein QOG55_1049, partial [Acidobacteriaceae bacterium]|nr:hypothetical protein [Acidobacteriaceae bacterium]
ARGVAGVMVEVIKGPGIDAGDNTLCFATSITR